MTSATGKRPAAGPHPVMLICFETFRQQESSEEPSPAPFFLYRHQLTRETLPENGHSVSELTIEWPLTGRSRFKPFVTVRLPSLFVSQ